MEIKHIVGFFLIGIMFNINCQAQQVTKKEAVRAAINTIRYESIGNADGTVDTVYTKTTEKDTLMYEVVY